MLVKKFRCDVCGKETENIYNETYWIQFQDGLRLLLSAGRDYQKNARTAMFTSNAADFCSFDCLTKKFRELHDKALATRTSELTGTTVLSGTTITTLT